MLIFGLGAALFISAAVIAGVLRIKRLDKNQMLIFIYCSVSLVSEIITHVLREKRMTNMPVINGFVIIEFFILSFFYSQLFERKKTFHVFVALWILATVMVIVELFYRQFNQYFSFFSLFSNLVLVLCAVLFFRKILIEQPVDIITDYYLFWLNSACFVYFSCTSIIFCLQNLPGDYLKTHQIIIFTHILFNYIFYLLFTIGLCKPVQK